MMRILKYVAGLCFMLFAAIKAAVLLVAAVQGAIEVPSNMTTTRAALDSFLQWLTSSNPVVGYGFSAALFALGFGILFWHPEKGWTFYFEKQRVPSAPSAIPKVAGLSSPEVEPIVSQVVKHDAPKQIGSTLDGRDYIKRSVTELLDIFSKNTDYHAKILFEPYVGGWISIRGFIRDIYELGADEIAIQVWDAEETGLTCQFDRKTWAKIIARLNKGDEISAAGEISSSQSGLYLRLKNCEFVDKPAPQTSIPKAQ